MDGADGPMGLVGAGRDSRRRLSRPLFRHVPVLGADGHGSGRGRNRLGRCFRTSLSDHRRTGGLGVRKPIASLQQKTQDYSDKNEIQATPNWADFCLSDRKLEQVGNLRRLPAANSLLADGIYHLGAPAMLIKDWDKTLDVTNDPRGTSRKAPPERAAGRRRKNGRLTAEKHAPCYNEDSSRLDRVQAQNESEPRMNP